MPATSLIPAVLAVALTVPIAGPPAADAGRLAAAATPAAAPGAATRISDFDGDARPDVVIGGAEDPRTVQVRYATGRTQVVTRHDLDGSTAYTGFGRSVLARDLDADGYADLVIADSGDHQSDATQAVFLVPGSAAGLDTASARGFVPPPGLATFGTALALLDLPAPVLAVGAPSDRATGAGAVVLWNLGTDGLPSGGPALLTQDSPGVPGGGERGDAFGSSLAAAGAMLLVGAPGEAVGRIRQAGAVTVLTRRADGRFTGTVVTQATRGVPGSVEADDGFGAAVAAGDGHAVVGVPGEDGGRHGSAGRIQPFRVSGGKLKALPAISQSSPGVPGTSEPDDHFGAAVAVTRACAGVVGALVGAPGEAVGAVEFAGAAWVLPLAAGSRCKARSFFRGHGLPGRPHDLERVGAAVSSLRAADARLAAGLLIAGPGSEDGPSGSVYHLATPTGAATTPFSNLYTPSGISLTP